MEGQDEVGQDGKVEAAMGVWNFCWGQASEWRTARVNKIGCNEDEIGEKNHSGAAAV